MQIRLPEKLARRMKRLKITHGLSWSALVVQALSEFELMLSEKK
jgi:hypothetical protein